MEAIKIPWQVIMSALTAHFNLFNTLKCCRIRMKIAILLLEYIGMGVEIQLFKIEIKSISSCGSHCHRTILHFRARETYHILLLAMLCDKIPFKICVEDRVGFPITFITYKARSLQCLNSKIYVSFVPEPFILKLV